MTVLSWSLPRVFIQNYSVSESANVVPRTEMTRTETSGTTACRYFTAPRPLYRPSRWSTFLRTGTVATVCTSKQDELARYKALKVPAASQSVLQYRKHQTSECPILSELRDELFCIPASWLSRSVTFRQSAERPPMPDLSYRRLK